MTGKGDTPRAYNKKRYNDNFDKIFKNVKQSELPTKRMQAQ